VGAFAFLSATSLDAALDHKGSENGHAVKVSSAGSTTGVALVELYELPKPIWASNVYDAAS
jgi:hypothetical protein